MFTETNPRVIELLRMQNKILETRLHRLDLLKRHYEEDSQLKLERFHKSMEALVSKTQYTAFIVLKNRIDSLEAKLSSKLAEERSQVDAYKNLDPDLMAEFLRLKDDLECQEMLIKMSNDNSFYRTP